MVLWLISFGDGEMTGKNSIGLLGKILVFLMMKGVLVSDSWLMLLPLFNSNNCGFLGPRKLFGVIFYLPSTVKGPILLLRNGILGNL